MKTRQLKILLHELSSLNNSFTHYFFVWSQFSLDYEKTIADNQDALTSSFFKQNSYSKKHQIKLSKLDNEHLKTNTTLLNGIFTLIYSSFENYLTDVYTVAQNIDLSLPDLNEGKYEKDDVLLLKVLNRLGLREKFDDSYLSTFDYIRLKRNRLVHSSSINISRSFRDIINKDGHKLNSLWNGILPKRLQEIDFSDSENASLLTYNILIDLLNIVRGIANYIDSLIFETFDFSDFLSREVLVEFKNVNGIKNFNLTDERNKRKFLGFFKSQYGYKHEAIDFTGMV